MKRYLFIAGLIIASSFFIANSALAQITMYGLTSGGGSAGGGTLFSVTSTGTVTVIGRLNPTFGAVPFGSPCYASDGNFYATSLSGGYGDSCAVFRCAMNGTMATMINLDTVWGSSVPQGNNLIQALDGNLYGLLNAAETDGVLYKLQLNGKYSGLHFFGGISDGSFPRGSLIQTNDSNLWGMTSAGGTFNGGIIFCMSPSGNYSVKYNFDSLPNDGIGPLGSLLLANDGNFYGVTSMGGLYNLGTVFRFNPSGSYLKLADFNDTNGATPTGTLIQGIDGNLYGTTSAGGAKQVNDSSYGTLFKCTLLGHLTTLVSFNKTNGAYPYGSLHQAGDSNFYGMTEAGGAHDLGTIFQYSIIGGLNKLVDLNDSTGFNPYYGKLIEISQPASVAYLVNKMKISVFPNPSDDVFNISANGEKEISRISIYNALGQEVLTQQINMQSTSFRIKLGNQAPGVYLYHLVSGDGSELAFGKLIKE